MGSKYKPTVSSTPGPGQYADEQNYYAKGKSSKIGSTSRPDIWRNESKNDAPGPGNYMETLGTFGKNVKGLATMGSKHKSVQNLTPGPGSYDAGAHKTMRPTSSYGKIGTTKKPDLWGTDKQTLEARPGPGHHHSASQSLFGQTKGGSFGLTSSRKDIKNSNPGPG